MLSDTSTLGGLDGSSSVKKKKGSKGKPGGKNRHFMGTWTTGFSKAKDDIFMTIWYKKFLRTKHSVKLEPLNMNKSKFGALGIDGAGTSQSQMLSQSSMDGMSQSRM